MDATSVVGGVKSSLYASGASPNPPHRSGMAVAH